MSKYDSIKWSIENWTKNTKVVWDVKLLIKTAIAHQLCMDCFTNQVPFKTFHQIVNKYKITLEDLILANNMGIKARTKRQFTPSSIRSTIIRFIYYSKIYEKYPFALTSQELNKLIIMEAGDLLTKNKIKIDAASIFQSKRAHYAGQRRTSWSYYSGQLFGQFYTPGTRGGRGKTKISLPAKARLIVKHDYETAVRLLLEGKEANAPRIAVYEQLYNKKKISISGGRFGGSEIARDPVGFKIIKTTAKIDEHGEHLLGLLFGNEKEQIEFRKKWEKFKKIKYKGNLVRDEFFYK